MKAKKSNTPIEIWGGIECTVNRVGDQYFDQLKRSGHYDRSIDLSLFADIGLQKIRYPVLWEKIRPDLNQEPDWKWTDERLYALKSLGITPIVGLLHHGSGPNYTNLLDPDFPDLFATFAGSVAERYPWLKYFTPINEPLTTARFSALYGLWFPHLKDDLSFSRAIINQVVATKKAMKAIRSVIPHAKLVQTEDLGKTHSTKVLDYQAKFENERRWTTFDMLMGRITPDHKMWSYFLWAGIRESELEVLLEDSCPPDVIGINHYLSSERYLDDRIANYPIHLQGGNGKHRYADIEAVRVGPLEPAGFYNLLKETCRRYEDTSVAITEVHMGGTREEQLRWFHGAWKAANDLLKEGYDIKAITAWALLGLYDWNSLLLEDSSYYESGLFDVRGNVPRPTALADIIKNLTTGKAEFPSLARLPGWWQRAERIHIVQPKANLILQKIDYSSFEGASPVLITGGNGTLGLAFSKVCQTRGIPYRLLSRSDMDITDTEKIEAIISDLKPWAIINAAGYSKIDKAENEELKCYRENSEGPAILAAICHSKDIKFMSFSSDQVFNGRHNKPYLEDHLLSPLGIYGMSKKRAEEKVLSNNPKALMVRTSAFFSPWDDHNFASQVMLALKSKKNFYAVNDQFFSPTYLPDLVDICLDLLIDGEYGVWNITNPCEINWADFAKRIAKIACFETASVVPLPSKKMNYIAKRPFYSVLGSKRGVLLSSLDEGLEKFIEQRKMIDEV